MSIAPLQTRFENPPSLDDNLGPVVAGCMVAIFLYGAMVVQVFCYYQHDFKKDSVWIKSLVLWTTILETLHTILIAISLYESAVTHFGDYIYLPRVHWPLSYSVAVGAAISASVQILGCLKTFYAFRVYTLSGKWWYLVLIALASLARFGLALAGVLLIEKVDSLQIFRNEGIGYIVSVLAVGITVDILNTTALALILARQKGHAVRNSRRMIDKLVLWTIETGLLTSVASFASFLLVFTRPYQAAWICPVSFTAKLFSNSLLASLNGRVSLRASNATVHTDIGFASPYPSAGPESGIHFRSHQQTDGVVLSALTIARNKANDCDQPQPRDFSASSSGPDNLAIYMRDPEASF
ncbi:hypothetical protein V5O48_012865 [Marasmius crinis-equi]|uniref:DUF6534 domain-containing protein n=1 Tax=Marasmius crinis-equi TaxID=585013 RepID=A0ABR3F1N5_9AGAR